jgi:nucleoside-diphosphate-sugar epimerase
VNAGGARNVARAVREHGVGRLLHVSTTDVFGFPEAGCTIDERSPFRPWHEPYADTKIEAEQRLWEAYRADGVPLTVIYPGWVYGPGDRAFFPGLAEAIRGGFMLFWARDVRLAWVYVDNLIDACVRASEAAQAVGEGFIVYDTLEGPTLEEVCGRIAARLGARKPGWRVPYALALAVARAAEIAWRAVGAESAPPLRSVDVKAFGAQWRFSNAKARRELGWAPRVGIDEGMARALDALARDGEAVRGDRGPRPIAGPTAARQ